MQNSWHGSVPFGPHGAEIEVWVHGVRRLEIPDHTRGDPLPEISEVHSLAIAGYPATFARISLRPRGLRALYQDRSSLTQYALYLPQGEAGHLFRLTGGQFGQGVEAEWLKDQVRGLETSLLQNDLDALAKSGFVTQVKELVEAGKPLWKERQLLLCEAVAEIQGELRFLEPHEGAAPWALPVSPKEPVALAFRWEEEEHEVGFETTRSRRRAARKGSRVELAGTSLEGEPWLEKASIQKEGWVELPARRLESARALRLQVGAKGKVRFRTPLVLRYGRPEEPRLDGLVPRFSARNLGPPAPKLAWIREDVERCWDPDRGEFRGALAGQLHPADLEDWEILSKALPQDLAADVRAGLLTRTYHQKGAVPELGYALGRGGISTLAKAILPRLEEFSKEPYDVWTEDMARALQDWTRLARFRPHPKLKAWIHQLSEVLLVRLRTQPEPTWRHRNMQRPIKTFKANPDVAQPHAEAILALLDVLPLAPESDSILDSILEQARHLVREHPASGEPPAYVLGSWKDRARLETPLRIGVAFSRLSQQDTLGGWSERAKRSLELVWGRYHQVREQLEAKERILLLGWLDQEQSRASGSGCDTL